MAKKLLIVDDEASIRKMYGRIFSEEDYTVTLAVNIAEARAFMQVSDYDLIITDLVLTDGSGTEILQLASDRGKRPGMILVSGAIEPWEAPLFIEKYSLAECFVKPFRVDSLLLAIEKLMGGAADEKKTPRP